MTLSEDEILAAANGQTKKNKSPYFENGKFIPKRLAEAIVAEMPVATGGRALYVYVQGCYQPGEERLARRITELLGEDWRLTHEAGTLGYLHSNAAPLDERPPMDRVNLINGILTVGARKLAKHTPALRTSVQLGVSYDAKATCPAIDRFLADVLDEETVPLFYEIAAYLMLPDNTLQKAIMLLGPGGNGKSTMLRLLTAFLGPGNVSSVSLHDLSDDRFAKAGLFGKLANVVADLDARELRSAASFKAITGGDVIRAERKYHPAFEYVPFARLLFSANAPPPTPDSSVAFFDRWVVVPLEKRIRASAAEDRKLLEKLTTPSELSGLLNRALDVLPDVHERGLRTTETMADARKAFREEVDSVAGFATDRCVLGDGFRTDRTNLYGSYANWCRDGGRMPLSRHRFYRRLQEVCAEEGTALELKVVQGARFFDGIGMAP